MNIKLVKVSVVFVQQQKAQHVSLDVYYPLVDHIIYQPIKWVIKSGVLSNDYLNNKSESKQSDRDSKSKLLKEITISNNDDRTFTIVNEKNYFHNFDSKGLGAVAFIKKLTGSNSNRFAKLYIKTEFDDYKGLVLGHLFQDPNNISKTARKEFQRIALPNVETITFDEFVVSEDEYARKLNSHYYDNIKTCSTHDIEITMNKNGQLKRKIYKEIIGSLKKEVQEAQRAQIESTGMIMNAFKRGLDERFGFEYSTRKCLICNLNHPNMLVASHIKARSESENIEEKIDPNNGFWLCAQHDRAFDRRLITFNNDGKVIISEKLKKENIFDENYVLPTKVLEESKKFLSYHNLKYEEKFG